MNEIPVSNSKAKCLLENWIEERNVAHIDKLNLTDLDSHGNSYAKLLKTGHKGLLTTDFAGKSTAGLKTTVQATYTPPKGSNVQEVGCRTMTEERMLYERALAEIQAEEENEKVKDMEDIPKVSVTHLDYYSEPFLSKHPDPTAAHSIKEQPVSFWTEHRDVIHGKSQEKNFDTPFRKNTSFSKPIGEYYDQPKPYEMENWPKM